MKKREFRVREQYGKFFVEEKVEWNHKKIKKGWFKDIVSIEKRKKWIGIYDKYPFTFIEHETLEDSLNYISTLDPIYHEVK